MDRIYIADLTLHCIIGVFPEERREKQKLIINVTMDADLAAAGKSDELADSVDYKAVKKRIMKVVEDSEYRLIESVAHRIADTCLEDPDVSREAKSYAAMVTMVDRNVGEVLDLLAELKLEDNTIVFFTGDNGGQDRFASKRYPRGFFGPNVEPKTGVEFRGGKGNLYEGGLRIPFIVRWPGKVASGRVSDLLFYQPDVLPTLADLAGAETPADVDGLSILPELIGAETAGREQPQHEFLYWEYGSQTAVRRDDWKAIRPHGNAAWELYDLAEDVSETKNVADEHADILTQMTAFAERSHTPVQPGTYRDRTRHERDRRAKWGSTRAEVVPPSGKVHKIEDKGLIPAGEMKLIRFSSENGGNDRRAAYAIDGNPRTVWHSQFSEKLAVHPHELVIDLGADYEVRGFRYLARQDGGWNGAFADTEFYVGSSPDDFDSPVAKVKFKKIRTAQRADCDQPVRGRYLRIRILSEVGGNAWGSAAEIGVVGSEVKD